MTLGGIIIMTVSVGGVISFFSWCIFRVFTEPDSKETMHAPLDADIDTGDKD